MYEIALLPVIVAAVVNVAIGFAWYHPSVFGTMWMNWSGVRPNMEEAKKKMPVSVGAAFLASVLTAYVLNHFGIAWGVFDAVAAFELGFWTWAGFVAPVMLGIVLWEGKPIKLYVLNIAYWLVALVAMSEVLVLMA